MRSREHSSSRSEGSLNRKIISVVLGMGVIGIVTTHCHGKVEKVLQAEEAMNESPPSHRVPLSPIGKPAKKTTPHNFSEGRPRNDSLPTLSSGAVNMVNIFAGIYGCGIWEDCQIPSMECGSGRTRPIQCKSEDGWLYFDFDADTNTVGVSSDPCHAGNGYTPTVLWSNHPEILCQRFEDYETARGIAMDHLWGEAGFYRSGTGESGSTFDLDFKNRQYSMVVDGEVLHVTKWHVRLPIDGQSGAVVKVAGVNQSGTIKVRAFYLEGSDPEQIVEASEDLQDELELKEELGNR